MLSNHYSIKDLQNVIEISRQLNSPKMTVGQLSLFLNREIQKRLNEMDSNFSTSRRVKQKRIRKQSCPECSSTNYALNVRREGITYHACKQCRYSEMVK